MAKKDYYQILGIEKSANRDEIKKAYKTLAKKYHPDLNKDDPSSAEKFKEINEAASVLSDDKKREQYDRYGSTEGMGAEGFSGFDFSDFGSQFDFGDIFDTFFGGGHGSRRRSARGSDLQYDLEIDLEEAASGSSRHITIPRLEVCGYCHGLGAKDENAIKACEECHGSGRVTRRQQTPFGMFQSTAPCRRCGGVGKVISEECSHCEGQGRVRKSRKIEVQIPKGVTDGIRLRITGEGESGPAGSASGDLYIVMHIKPHKVFERVDSDLYTEVTMSFVLASLGGEVDVPTLDGNATIKIPAGTQTGTLFRIKGKGMPHLRGHDHGDLKVRVTIETPSKLTKRQKELLKEFDEETKKNKGLFDRIKEAF